MNTTKIIQNKISKIKSNLAYVVYSLVLTVFKISQKLYLKHDIIYSLFCTT